MRRLAILSSLGLLLTATLVWAVMLHETTDRYHFKQGADGVTTIAVTYCCELAENGTIHCGPVLPLTTPTPALDAAVCDTNTSTNATTADVPAFVTMTSRPMKMACTTAATLGAGESIVVTLRADAAAIQGGGGDFACTIGAADLTCEERVPGDALLPANTPTAIRAVMSSNNADGEDVLCVVWYQVD